jgi:drug/metabolite transporter, DME family
VSGVLWAALAGLGFGLFQTTNRASIDDVDIYRSTFVQLLVSAAILVAASAATEDLSQLGRAPVWALVDFSVAGLLHFFVGWTLLNASQKRLGAARTSSLIATTPLFGVVVAALALGEAPSAVALAGVGLIVGGVSVIGLEGMRQTQRVAQATAVSRPERSGPGPEPRKHSLGAGGTEGFSWSATLFGLGTALCWAISPVFIRRGLEGLSSPLLGVTVSLVASTVAYGIALSASGRTRGASASRRAWAWKLTAGVFVGLSTWARWYALALTPVAVVLGLGLLSVPTVIVLAPLVVGRHVERVTRLVVAGTVLIVSGALILILRS